MHSGRTIDSQKMSENEFLEKKVLDSEFTLRADHPSQFCHELSFNKPILRKTIYACSSKKPTNYVIP